MERVLAYEQFDSDPGCRDRDLRNLELEVICELP
jgi:hypothetical protein